MAFFGLTALGPQNTFLSVSKVFRNLQIFDETDFIAAWEKVNGTGSKFCAAEKLGEIMRELFRGPVPENDNEQIVRAFEKEAESFESEGMIPYVVYCATMVRLAKEAEEAEEFAENNPLPTCEYTSSKEIQLARLRNRTFKFDPNQKQHTPVTCQQEYGWHDGSEILKNGTRASRKQSDITKFAAELIKNGVY
jgi:hypothetical protein